MSSSWTSSSPLVPCLIFSWNVGYCTCVLSTSCVILVREEDMAVGTTSKFVISTPSLCPFIRATRILSCVDAKLTIVLQCGQTFENHFGALCIDMCLCALRRDLLAKVLNWRWAQPLDFPSFGWQVSCCHRHRIFGYRIFVHFGTHRLDSHDSFERASCRRPPSE